MIYLISGVILTFSLLQTSPALSTESPRPILFNLEGKYTHPISTKEPLAQQYFNQGMVFYYGYNFDEAARDFDESARIDPKCAMCYWGKAIALRGNIESEENPRFARALESAKQAQNLIQNASPEERAYILALVNSYLQYSNSLNDLDLAFVIEMQKVAEQYPNDADAQTIYVERSNRNHSFDDIKQKYLKIMEMNPNHPGANHYYIHALDASSSSQEGVEVAKRLSTLYPFAGHLMHMPAHVYFKLGRFQEASQANERALKADRILFEKGGLKDRYFASYHLHNFQFYIASLTMEGKLDEALKISQKLTDAMEKEKILPSIYMQNALAAQRLLVLQRQENWEQILKEPNPGTPFGNGLWHFARSQAFLARNDIEKAKAEAALIQEQQVDQSEDDLNTQLKVFYLNAIAAIEEKEGNPSEMIKHYEEAMPLEDKISYFEPPLWFSSSREALGFTQLRAGNRAEAEKWFQEDLKKHPQKIWSMNALKKS